MIISRAVSWLAVAVLLGGSVTFSADNSIGLPKPQTEGGKPLMQALASRQTHREIGAGPLKRQVLANLLWAAFGVNRPDSGHRTAPSAMNAQEIDVYVATADGLFLYEAGGNQLKRRGSEDVRSQISRPELARQAPVSLIFVADYARMVKAKPEQKEFYSAIDAGCIVQNVYLFCASEGLATVVHDLDRAKLSAAMKLGPEQKIVLAQAVGFAKQQ